MNCPCHTERLYETCCGRFISQHQRPENAEQLMRSRYTAYVLKNQQYLMQTWHQDFRPSALDLEQNLRWIKLNVLDFEETMNQATVTFEAFFISQGKVDVLCEKSQFVKKNNDWLYTSGEMLTTTHVSWKPGRNELCPCASQKKFKRCCGK